jgi:ParB-like chromosome segregation protein Spo0J
MSETLDLLEEASLTIRHGRSILRLAALHSKDEALARDLWRRSAAVEAMADELKNLFASLRHPSAAGGSARTEGPASADSSP